MITNAHKWLLLDNLKHKWPHATSIRQEVADECLRWAIDNGLVADGKITSAGEAWMLVH